MKMKTYKVPTLVIKSGWTEIKGEDISDVRDNFVESMTKGEDLDSYPDDNIPMRMFIGKVNPTGDGFIRPEELISTISLEDIVEIVKH